MIELRAAPRSTSGSPRVVSGRFASAAEAAVAKYAPRIWEGVLAAYLRRLRLILAGLEPVLSRLVVEPQAQVQIRVDPSGDPAIAHIESLIHQIAQGVKDPDLSSYASGLASDMVFDRGLLATDQRISTLVATAQSLIESKLFEYWRNLNSPPYLARKIYEAKAAGLSGQPLYNKLAREARTGFYSAERLVRTTYTAGSNRSTWDGLKASGYTGMRWVSSHDSRVRPGAHGKKEFDHRVMDGMIVGIDEVFVSPTSRARLQFPGDHTHGAPGGEIYNCRCTIVGVMLQKGRTPSPSPVAPSLEPDPAGGDPSKEIEAWKASVMATIDRLEQDRAKIEALQTDINMLRRRMDSVKKPPDELPTSDPRWKAYFDKKSVIRGHIQEAFTSQQAIYGRINPQAHEALRSPRGPAREGVLNPRNRNNRENTEKAVKWIRETLGPGLIDERGDGPTFNAPRSLWRAYHDPYKNSVNFNSHEGIRTIVHEVGHWVEVRVGMRLRAGSTYAYDRPILERAVAWRESRTQGEPTISLRQATGNSAYERDEVTKPDKFLSPYVGKLYGPSATEVVSMGLEELYADPVGFRQKDRGHFELMLELIGLNRKGIP